MNPPIQQEQNPEPYRPEGMPKLEVGMRVRWRISPECGFKCPDCAMDWHGYPSGGTGSVGNVIDDGWEMKCSMLEDGGCGRSYKNRHSHNFFIRADEPILQMEDDGFWAAASELIPLGPDEEGE